MHPLTTGLQQNVSLLHVGLGDLMADLLHTGRGVAAARGAGLPRHRHKAGAVLAVAVC